jgi:hypothetical protein
MKPAEFAAFLEVMDKFSFMDLLARHKIKGSPRDNNRCPLARLATKLTGIKCAIDNDYLFAQDGAEEFGHLPLPLWAKIWRGDFDRGQYKQFSDEKHGEILSPGEWEKRKEREKKERKQRFENTGRDTKGES